MPYSARQKGYLDLNLFYFYTNPTGNYVHHDNFLTHVDRFPILLLHLLYESQNKELCQRLALSICLYGLQFSLSDTSNLLEDEAILIISSTSSLHSPHQALSRVLQKMLGSLRDVNVMSAKRGNG